MNDDWGDGWDGFLEKRMRVYDRWIAAGKLPFSSKVVPVRESIDAQQWVVPTEQVLGLIRNARSYVLIDCDCRTRYHRCDNPIETCFLINDVADEYLARGEGRAVSLEEAERVLRLANEHGLVHLTIYNPTQYVYAICSCCTCCCHDLQMLRLRGRSDLVAHSDYVASVDQDACTHCGVCVDRCVFDACAWEDGEVRHDPRACFGCGLCVSTCPVEAISMVRRGEQR